ncbi:MAG: radical SAM protein [Betaproteobacteria bacterium]|nr:radical SAM protein [Betaproteobacteria bacterium]
MMKPLAITDHSRNQAGLTYVYPVLSRRAGGISVGINLNPNRACNWSCVYCQVEGLRRGKPDPVQIELLADELRGFLLYALSGDYPARHVKEAKLRQLADIAFSGDGEPTCAAEFAEVVERVVAVMQEFDLIGRLPLRLITNGSMAGRKKTREGLATLALAGGEVWFKIDRGDAAGIFAVNQTRLVPETVLRRLKLCAEIAPVWAQTCWFAHNGKEPDRAAKEHYLALIQRAAGFIQGIHLYGLARPPQSPHAAGLSRLPPETLAAWGEEIAAKTGVKVICSP